MSDHQNCHGHGHSHHDHNGRTQVVDELIQKLSVASEVPGDKKTFAEIQAKSTLPPLRFESYSSEKQLPDVMRLITKDLSEPYSVYTYRYFVNQWPNLCFLAYAENGDLVGTIVCKLDEHRGRNRGYIAMLAVDDGYRRQGIGSALVEHAVDAMAADSCDEVVLETEVTNKVALALYERLGFVADRRLFRYYLNGHDAFRLKLWLS